MKREKILRLYAEFTGETAKVIKSLSYGFKKSFIQALVDDFIADCKNPKELKSDIVDYHGGKIKIIKIKTNENEDKETEDNIESNDDYTDEPSSDNQASKLKDLKKNIDFD